MMCEKITSPRTIWNTINYEIVSGNRVALVDGLQIFLNAHEYTKSLSLPYRG